MGETARASSLKVGVKAAMIKLTHDRSLSQVLGSILSFLVITIGGIVLFAAKRLDSAFGREFGIAFVTSGLVTLIYELHARAQKDRETMAGVLRLVFGDIVTENFWDEFKKQIFGRKILRKDASIEIKVEEDPSLPKDQLILCSTFSYKLHGLRPTPEPVTLVHRLNFHIRAESAPSGPLPKFEHVTIDGSDVSKGKLAESRGEGKTLAIPVILNPKEPLDVRVCRRELTYVPGSYNFVLAELTAGVTLHVDGIPEGFTAKIFFGPEFPAQTLSSPGSLSMKNKLFLPGHCIEFRLEREVEKNPEVTS